MASRVKELILRVNESRASTIIEPVHEISNNV